MKTNKIVFLCHFSNSIVREKLYLHRYALRKIILNLKGGGHIYDDFAIWVSDYIAEFENHPEVEIHIVAPHAGMKRKVQSFEHNGIHYHFFRWNYGIIYLHTYLDKLFHIDEKTNHKRNREIISSIVNEIKPALVILCGAENPHYSTGVLDVKNIPVYVILQTLLNDPKRIEMGIGSPYRRKIELEIFRHAHYFCSRGEKAVNMIKAVNAQALICPVRFPTHRPVVFLPEKKEYDFVFFSRIVKPNKGIEDLLQALALVKNSYSKVSLNIIGGCGGDYKNHLKDMVVQLGIEGNVHFAGYYANINETFNNVAKAKAVVVPGITAGLNSTVREAMFMKMPTICYETKTTTAINQDKTCLFIARMENVQDLARQMQKVLDYPDQAQTIAANGYDYAERVFSNKAIVNNLLMYCKQIIEDNSK